MSKLYFHVMASVHPISVSPEELQELDAESVQDETQNIIQNLKLASCQELTSFSNLEYDKTIHEFLKKLNEMIFKLEQISSILTEFLDANYFFEKLVASKKDSAEETLEQVQDCIKIAESYVPKIRRIRGNSERVYMILIQFVLEGIEIPQMEDFGSQVQLSISHIVRHSVEGGNTAQPVEVVTKFILVPLINALANQFAGARRDLFFLNATISFITKVSSSLVKTTSRLLIYRMDSYDKIFEFKRQFTECGVKKHLERLSRYLDQAITNSQSGDTIIIAAIKQCLCQVQESVKNSKQQDPNKSEIDIVKEMSETPNCSGLVQPITTNMGCSLDQAWNIVIQLFSSRSNTPALL